MLFSKTPEVALAALLQDACERDLTTARRTNLLKILWQERYLTRSQLITRLEDLLGEGCFGTASWEDTFYRDMRVVKKSLKHAGYTLAYSRRKSQTGYYIRGEPRIHPHLAGVLDGSVREVDIHQIEINQKLSPAERFQKGCSITDLAWDVVSHRQELCTKKSGTVKLQAPRAGLINQ